MRLIVGLGNPGPEYDRTRHNVGFDVIDHLARRFAPGEIARGRFHGLTLDARIAGEKVMLLKPTTYMNCSGLSVAEAVRFFKLEPTEDVMVVVDDIALPCGAIRLRGKGGDGGHNGLADITQKLATDDYARLRVGIDKPGRIPQKDYVLGKFRPEQRELVDDATNDAADAAAFWVEHGLLDTMNRFNRRTTKATNASDSDQPITSQDT
ncbi:MAG: aminoacyl-tRNA hydrolase [Phycisphaerales bacterium]|nr:aminoacyl-tRNA hydrolase [Phycisphaerales bacterium]